MKRKFLSLKKSKFLFIFFLIVSTNYNCVPWPSVLLGTLVVRNGEKSPILFSPLGSSVFAGMGNSTITNVFPEDPSIPESSGSKKWIFDF